MLKILTFNDAEWIVNRDTATEILPQASITDTSIILVDDSRYIGILNNNGRSAMYDHIIFDKTVANRDFINKIFKEIFRTAVCVNSFIDNDNKQAMRFTTGLGFMHTGTIIYAEQIIQIFHMGKEQWQNNRLKLNDI